MQFVNQVGSEAVVGSVAGSCILGPVCTLTPVEAIAGDAGRTLEGLG